MMMCKSTASGSPARYAVQYNPCSITRSKGGDKDQHRPDENDLREYDDQSNRSQIVVSRNSARHADRRAATV